MTVFLMPKPGTVQPCMESAAVPMMRIVVPLGITISSSTASRRGILGFCLTRSASARMRLSTEKLPWSG